MANGVLEAQKMLTKLGYTLGPIDGVYGGKTKRALENYYNDNNKNYDGKLDKNEIAELKTSIRAYDASPPKLKKFKHIQHARYSKHIATQFRTLKVNENFKLIDDFNTFMAFHKRLKGSMPDNEGSFYYASEVQKMNFDFCVDDYIFTTSNRSNPLMTPAHAVSNCTRMLSQKFLNNPQDGINNYRKILLGWLEHGIVHNPNKFGAMLPENSMAYWNFGVSVNVPNILTHYAVYHKLYDFDQYIHQRIIQMGEAYYTQWDYYPLITRSGPFMEKLCNLKSQYKVVIGSNDHCGTFTLIMATGGIYFGLEFNKQLVFDTGVRNLEIVLATLNKDAVYTAQAARGICALGYMKEFAPNFDLIHYALYKAFGIDFVNVKNINGVTPAEVYLKTWEIAHDPLETVVKYWNGFDQMGCSRNGKNQAAMVAELKKRPDSFKDFWNGFNYEDFVLSSPILAKQVFEDVWIEMDRSHRLSDKSMSDITVSGNYLPGINPYLLQFALGNFEDERRKYAEEHKKKIAEQREQEKAERLKRREILHSYDGIYKVKIGQYFDVINGQAYQDLGSILFALERAQPKLDENNILYDALGLEEINFSLDYNGDLIVSGQAVDAKTLERRCVYLFGSLKSNEKLYPKSSQNCYVHEQRFSMKFEKISDNTSLTPLEQIDLNELDGNYDVQWFMTNMNSNERKLQAKDILTLSNGKGVFLGDDPDKQPSSDLRKKLSVQYNVDGEIIILGRLDLFEKTDVKNWYTSGEISAMNKTVLTSIWGFGDKIELVIERRQVNNIPKLIKSENTDFIYGDDYIFDDKTGSYQLNRRSSVTKIQQMDWSLRVNSDNEKLFGGDVEYRTNKNAFDATWIDLSIKRNAKGGQDLKIAFQLEAGIFSDFAELLSPMKKKCGFFSEMPDDSLIVPVKTINLTELELFTCHIEYLKKELDENGFEILRDRVDTAISLIQALNLPKEYIELLNVLD